MILSIGSELLFENSYFLTRTVPVHSTRTKRLRRATYVQYLKPCPLYFDGELDPLICKCIRIIFLHLPNNSALTKWYNLHQFQRKCAKRLIGWIQKLNFFFSNIKFKSEEECIYCECEIICCNAVPTNAIAPNNVFLN